MDLESSEELASQLGELFPEEELYRIDHYLGKELSQVKCSIVTTTMLQVALEEPDALHSPFLAGWYKATGMMHVPACVLDMSCC